MAFTNEPLVYFGNNSDFEANYNYTADENRNKQAVFVGDTHMIYTHGVAFNGNDTVYNDGELRGLIGGLQDQDETINGQIETLLGLVEDVQGDLLGLHDWSQEDIDGRIQALISDAEWMRDNFPNEIISQSNFGEDDVEEYLQRIGVITIDEETGQPVVTWSTFQQSYNSLESRVDQLEQNELDVEGLETRLHQYILDDTAIADLTSKWFWSHDGDIEWALAGLKTATNNAESFASVWSTMDKAINGDATQGTAGLVTKVSDLENNMVAKTELGTLVSQEGFATTAGTVAKSDLDGSVAALFSLTTSSTNTAVNNKLAGVITSSNLDNSVATLLASNGTGSASAVSTYVNNWWSGVTISGDKVNLTGKQLDAVFKDTGVNRSSLLTMDSSASTITVLNNALWKDYSTSLTSKGIRVLYSDADGDPYTDCSVDITDSYINVWQFEDDIEGNTSLYLTNAGLFEASSPTPSVLPDFYLGAFSIDDEYKYVAKVENVYADRINVGVLEAGDGVVQIHKVSNYGGASDIRIENGDITGTRNITSKNISLTEDYNEDGIEKTTITPYAITIYDTESDGAIAFCNGNGYFGLAPQENTINAILTSATVEIDGTNAKVFANEFEQTSDRTLKDIVSDTTLTVEQVADAPAVNFTWKKDAEKEDKKQNVGTIAQYWQVVLPEVVGEAKDGTLTFQYGNAAMVSSIVTAKEVVALKEEIAELKQQIAELKANRL